MRIRLLFGVVFGLLAGVVLWAQATHIHTSGTLPATCSIGDIYYKTGASAGFYTCTASNTWTIVGGGGAGALSAITAATGSNTIASGNNHSQVWNWVITDANAIGLTIGETSAGSGTDAALFGVSTVSTSAVMPVYIKNYGNAVSLRIDDVSGDTTPLLVDAAGNLCLLCSTQNSLYPLFINKNGFAIGITDGTSTIEIYNSSTIASIGTATNHPFWLEANSNDRIKVWPSGVTEFFRNGNPPTSIGTGATGLTNEYIHVGGNEATTNGYFLIGYGYATNATVPPAYIGFQEILDSGNTYGDLVFGTRSVTTDTAPSERMRILNDGTVNILDLKTTGAATGKNVVCVDIATGKLYASSTGTDCSN